MPYTVVEKDGEYCVFKAGSDGEPTGDTLGCHPTADEAGAQIGAIEKNEGAKAAVKAVGDWELDVLGVPYGGPDNGRDADGEYFDAATNLHDDRFGLPPVVYYHGFTPDGKPAGDPVFIGKTISRERRDDGVWYRVVLDKAIAEAKRIWEAAKKGLAAASSGSIQHLVRVDYDGHIRHWPVAEMTLVDVDGGRRPTNAYAVALPVMKAVYQAAGLPLPVECDLSNPEAEARGDRVTVAATAERSEGKPTEQGVREMDANEIKASVATAVAEALKAEREQQKAEAEAKAALEAEIKARIEAERTKWEAEAAKSGRLPTSDAPPVLTFDRKYDNLDAADHALLVSILDAGEKRLTGERREASLKALAGKAEADKGKDAAAFAGIKALQSRGIKTDEIMASTLANYGDDWVGIMYSTRLWEKIRTATPILAKLPSIEVPQGMESIYIPLESTDPTFYKVAQNDDLPTTEATGWPNATITSSKITTADTTLSVAKMGVRCLWTGEMEEDSLIPWVPNLRRQLERAGAEQMEYAIIDGDTATTASTNINDIAGTPGSTDLFLMCNGFRCLPLRLNTANARSAGTLTEEDFLETLKLMGVGGKNAAQLDAVDFIVDPWVHYKALELAKVQTRDVFGQPTIENGMLTSIWGHKIHVSHFMCYAGVVLGTVTTDAYKLKSQTADGKVDQDTEADNVAGTILAVRWDQWLMGWKRRMTIETTRIARADTTEIVALMRWGLVYRDTEASAASYGVSV